MTVTRNRKNVSLLTWKWKPTYGFSPLSLPLSLYFSFIFLFEKDAFRMLFQSDASFLSITSKSYFFQTFPFPLFARFLSPISFSPLFFFHSSIFFFLPLFTLIFSLHISHFHIYTYIYLYFPSPPFT